MPRSLPRRRRLGRGLFLASVALSTLLLLATGAIWAWSDHAPFRLTHRTPTDFMRVSARSGTLELRWDRERPARPGESNRPGGLRLWNGPRIYLIYNPNMKNPAHRGFLLDIRFPLWILAAIAFILPAAWSMVRLRRRRNPPPGHCPHCGYDLRATPTRCPECGRAVPS